MVFVVRFRIKVSLRCSSQALQITKFQGFEKFQDVASNLKLIAVAENGSRSYSFEIKRLIFLAMAQEIADIGLVFFYFLPIFK